MTTNTDPAFVAGTEELAEELRIRPQEAADALDRLYALERGMKIVTADGDVMEKAKHEAECKRLREYLMTYAAQHGLKSIEVEGRPALVVQEPQSDYVDSVALMHGETDVFYAIVEARAVKVDVKLAKQVLNPEQRMRFDAFVHPQPLTARLVWEKAR